MKTKFEERCKQLELEQIEQEITFETQLQSESEERKRAITEENQRELDKFIQEKQAQIQTIKNDFTQQQLLLEKGFEAIETSRARLEKDERILQTRIAELHKEQEELDTRVNTQLEQDHKLRKRAVFEDFEKKVSEYEEELDRKLEEEQDSLRKEFDQYAQSESKRLLKERDQQIKEFSDKVADQKKAYTSSIERKLEEYRKARESWLEVKRHKHKEESIIKYNEYKEQAELDFQKKRKDLNSKLEEIVWKLKRDHQKRLSDIEEKQAEEISSTSRNQVEQLKQVKERDIELRKKTQKDLEKKFLEWQRKEEELIESSKKQLKEQFDKTKRKQEEEEKANQEEERECYLQLEEGLAHLWPQPLYGKPTDEPILPNQRDFRHAVANRFENQECENYVSTTLTLLKVRREHALPAIINPYLEEKAREYNQTQEEVFESADEAEGEETTEEEGENSHSNQEDSSQEVVQVDGSSEKQKKRKVDFNPEVLETNTLGEYNKLSLKERRLLDSESEEGGRAKRPLTLDIAKAKKYSTRIPKTPSEESKESYFFTFQPSSQTSGRNKLGTYPQGPIRLDTDTNSQLAEETIVSLPAEVERQLRIEGEKLKQKQRADTLDLEGESEEMEARLSQIVSQNSLEMADLRNQLLRVQLQQAQQGNVQNAGGGGATVSIFGTGKSIPRFNMESDPSMSISDWIQLFNDVQDIRGVSVPIKIKDLKALLSGSVRSWLDDYLKQEGYNDSFVNANKATDEWFSLLLNKMQSMYSKDDQLTIDLGMNHPIQGDDEHVMTYYAKCSSYYKQRPIPMSNEERIREFLRHMKPKLKSAILQASHTMPNTMEAYLDLAKRIETVQRIGGKTFTVYPTVSNPIQEGLNSLLGLNAGQMNVPTVQASATPINQVTQPPINMTAGTVTDAWQTAAANKLLRDLTTYQMTNKPASGSVVGVVESMTHAPEANNQLVPMIAGLTGNYLANAMQNQVPQATPSQPTQQHTKPKHLNQNPNAKQDQNVKRGLEMFTQVMADADKVRCRNSNKN